MTPSSDRRSIAGTALYWAFWGAYCVVNALVSALLLKDAQAPFSSMTDFPFGCDGCGWAYRSKEIYAASAATEGLILLIATGLAVRYRRRWFTWVLLTLPVGGIWFFNLMSWRG